jgi:hypothetical protein
MQKATGESWKTLCKRAATEQDPQKLLELIREINRLLDEERTNRREFDKRVA